MWDQQVIIIGAGLAGMMAASTAVDEGADVLLIDRGSVGTGTNSAISNGLFTGPTSSYAEDEYIRDTLEIGKRINSIPVVKTVAREAGDAIQSFKLLGCELRELRECYVYKSSHEDSIRGIGMVRRIAHMVKTHERISVLTGFYTTAIRSEGDGFYSVEGYGRDGRQMSICAPAVVLAAGGASAIYARTDNQGTIMGLGYHLAAKAGLELRDMEFVQFYPIAFADPGMPSMMIYRPYPDEARIVNSRGEDLIEKYRLGNIENAASKRRDEFSAVMYRENQDGRVFMDFRHVPDPLWEKYPLSVFRKLNFDFRRNRFAVSPVTHFFMGGVPIDETAQTSLPGLFACGEVTWGLHGANRRGGNALMECLVFGRIAGRNAARWAAQQALRPKAPRDLPVRGAPSSQSCRERLKELRTALRELAWRTAGIIRDQELMQEGLLELGRIDEELHRTIPQNTAERRMKDDTSSGAFVLRAVLTAGTARKESRGSFFRTDFPEVDNLNWRKNSSLSYDPSTGEFKLHYEPARSESNE